MQRQGNTFDRTAHRRRGLLAPAVAVALLVVMSCVALVLDRLWLDAAHLELTTAAEAAALAAGHELASDSCLQTKNDASVRIEAARDAAVEIAGLNGVAGRRVDLTPQRGSSVRFGRLVTPRDTKAVRFLETSVAPTTVVVTARLTRKGRNPVALFFRELTEQPYADVAVRVEATLDNHVIALRPSAGTPIPILPLAICRQHSQQRPSQSWETQIVAARGQDRFSFNRETQSVQQQPDGIPEIVLSHSTTLQPAPSTNSRWVDVTGRGSLQIIAEHIERGWMPSDLRHLDGEISPLTSNVDLPVWHDSVGVFLDALRTHLGECRIYPLYDDMADDMHTTNQHPPRVRCVGFVAGRVMSITTGQGTGVEVVVQPAVLTTRTAVLWSERQTHVNFSDSANRYIYKLRVTN